MKHLITATLLVTTAACTLSPATDPPSTERRAAASSEAASTDGAQTSRATSDRQPRRRYPRLSPETIVAQVLREANIARRAVGARPLRRDARLALAAKHYSRELARRREIEHVSATPGRRTFRERIESEGVNPSVAGENLARLTASYRTVAGRTVQAWLRSPGHRSNLLDAIFTRTGVGVTLGRDGVWYVVQYYATTS